MGVLIELGWLGVVGLLAFGQAAKSTGDATNTASDGLAKLALAGVVLYIGAKKLGVVK